MKPVNQTAASNKGLRGLLHPQQLHLLSRQLEDPNGSFSNAEMSELSVAQKPEKLLERCKYWPACKNGDECAYHHPISPCKAFPNCKFAEKCLFVHPNCKYDAKCTKPDCPFTHVSRRIPVLSPKPAVAPPAPPSAVSSAVTSLLVRRWNVPSIIQNTVGLTLSVQDRTAHSTIPPLMFHHDMP